MQEGKDEGNPFKKEKLLILRSFRRALKRLTKAFEKTKKGLQASLNWQTVHHQAILLQSYFHRLKKGMHQIALPDFEKNGEEITIELDPLLEPKKQVDKLFRRAKKLRLGIPHMQALAKKMGVLLEQKEKELADLESIDAEEEWLKAIQGIKEASKASIEKKELKNAFKNKRYREYTTAAGCKILVGKTAKDNEYVTFQLAHGSDYWLHVSDYPGSHVLLRVLKNNLLDDASLQDALQVALYYSKARQRGEAEIAITFAKYVKRFKGSKTGQVQIANHKTMKVRLDMERIKYLISPLP